MATQMKIPIGTTYQSDNITPLDSALGVSPNQAGRFELAPVAARAEAVMGPIPRMVCRRRTTSLPREGSLGSVSSSPIRASRSRI